MKPRNKMGPPDLSIYTVMTLTENGVTYGQWIFFRLGTQYLAFQMGEGCKPNVQVFENEEHLLDYYNRLAKGAAEAPELIRIESSREN